MVFFTEGKKRFKHKQITVVSVTSKKKKKKQLKLKVTPKRGTIIIKNLSFKVSKCYLMSIISCAGVYEN